MIAISHLFLAIADPATPDQDIVSLLVGTIISTSVISALITAVAQYLINRKLSRVQERKNVVDEESDIVSRYKEAAVEERSQKESAVRTIQQLLDLAEKQVTSLRETINTLNALITTLNSAVNTQQDIIDSLTDERDRSSATLITALAQIEEQKTQLIRYKLDHGTGPLAILSPE